MEKTITKEALDRLKGIHKLSEEFNGTAGESHNERLIELVQKHAVEIKELMEKKDPHALVETGDLLILCFELLIENGVSIDETLLLCFGRYERKLAWLIEEGKG